MKRQLISQYAIKWKWTQEVKIVYGDDDPAAVFVSELKTISQ